MPSTKPVVTQSPAAPQNPKPTLPTKPTTNVAGPEPVQRRVSPSSVPVSENNFSSKTLPGPSRAAPGNNSPARDLSSRRTFAGTTSKSGTGFPKITSANA